MGETKSANRLDAFHAYRARMNQRILEEKDHLGLKRFFNLRHAVETIDLLRARENSKE